ncbi:MAG: dihydrodipicolinate synthase family protein [SAR86 cluster bacterium]|uniref:Dihydrodipicolinate synthase family protein n=1 Tax=SAR86 cluster bacterium TaxID=2030880 RepID=A0A2A4MNY3_9GAMM|nr:MAG: dihydrodipicolinate synthase family protein [SAR86 cluster bacterium]
MSSSDRFSGVLAPVITPFKTDLSIDTERLIKHCQWLRSQQVGLAVFGTNSEANSLSTTEKIQVLDRLTEAGIDPDAMMPGTGCCALSDSVSLTSHAVKLGCRGVLMLPPFFYKGVSDDGLYANYSQIIERVAEANLRLYLYHIPAFSGVGISVALIDRLVRDYPQTIAGIKDSSGDWENTKSYLDGGWDDFKVFCGSESFLLANMQNGGAGCISATANVNPAAIANLYQQWSSPGADDLQHELNKIRVIFQSLPMIAALKSATAICSGDDNWYRVRPPLTSLDEQSLQQLRQLLDDAQFTMAGL